MPRPVAGPFYFHITKKNSLLDVCSPCFCCHVYARRRGGGVFHPPASLPTVIAPSVMASASSASRGLGIDERRGRGAPPLRAGSWEIARKLLMQHVLLAPQLGENHMHSAT
jgi:hypothetical protein